MFYEIIFYYLNRLVCKSRMTHFLFTHFDMVPLGDLGELIFGEGNKKKYIYIFLLKKLNLAVFELISKLKNDRN